MGQFKAGKVTGVLIDAEEEWDYEQGKQEKKKKERKPMKTDEEKTLKKNVSKKR